MPWNHLKKMTILVPCTYTDFLKEMHISAVDYAFESLENIFHFHLCHHFNKFYALHILTFKKIRRVIPKN